jgi:hypothetical protein
MMAKSFIIALEGTTLTWYTRLPPLSIDSWRSLWDKFLLNFNGYRPDTDALAELSLCMQQEKETLRASYTVTASGTHPKTSKNSISCLKSSPDPKNSTSARSSLKRKPKDPPQSSQTWTRPSLSDSGRDSRSQQQLHNIANQHPAGKAPHRQDYPPRAAAMSRVVGAEDGRSSRADFTVCFMAKTARTQRIARKRRLPGTGCLGHSPPTTPELSRTHINTTSHNHTTTAPPSIYPTTHTNTTRRYKSYHPHFCLCTRISQTSTTKITPSTETGILR